MGILSGPLTLHESEWDEFTHTNRIIHENDSDGVAVEFEW